MEHLTITAEPPFKTFVDVSGRGPFEFSFRYATADDIKVSVNGVILADDNYTVANGEERIGGFEGGSISLLSDADEAEITVFSLTEISRVNDFANNGVSPGALNTELDRIVLMIRDRSSYTDENFKKVRDQLLSLEFGGAVLDGALIKQLLDEAGINLGNDNPDEPKVCKRVSVTVGNTVDHGTNYTISGEGGIYDFCGLDIIHQALNATGQAQLVTVEDVENVTIKNIKADGESATRNGITMRGVLKNIAIAGAVFSNMRNFAIQFADTRTDTVVSSLDGLSIENVRIDGDVGPTGAGSGLNLFPRSQDGNVPGAKNVWLHNNYIDVSQGEADNANHGPQAYKFNNILSLRGGYNWGKGGDVQCFSITNGCQDVDFDFIDLVFANRGLQIDSDANSVTTVTGDIRVRRLKYRHEGVIGERIGLYISGAVADINIKEIDSDGNISIISTDANETLNNLSLGDIKLKDGAVFSVVSAVPTLPITNARLGPFSVRDNGGGLAINLGNANRSFINAVIKTIDVTSANASIVQNYGTNNKFDGIYAVNGNLSGSANTAALIDFGDKTSIDFVDIQGGANALRYFVRKRGGNGFRIGSVSGTPTDVFGFAFENQENNDLPIGNVSVQSISVDLAAAAQEGVIWTASKTSYLLGARLFFEDGTSADAMKAIRLRRNSSNIINHSTASNLAPGAAINFTNTVGNNVAVASQRKFAEGDQLKFQTIGGGTGAGKARWIVTFVEEL